MLYFTMLCVVWQGILSLSPLIYAKQDSRERERQAARAKRNAAAHHDRHEEIGLPVNKLEKGLAFLLISLFHEPFRSAATAVSLL